MIDITPDPIFLRLLGFPIYWYGIAYAVGLAAAYWVLVREARVRGLDLFFLTRSWGLRPRLYAFACSAGSLNGSN